MLMTSSLFSKHEWDWDKMGFQDGLECRSEVLQHQIFTFHADSQLSFSRKDGKNRILPHFRV